MADHLWALGAPDPEMEAIARLLFAAGETTVYARDSSGRRVHPGNAYDAAPPEGEALYAIECGWRRDDTAPDNVVTVDHHRPGDPGYGRPAADFLAASSIGQVVSILADTALLGLRAISRWPRIEADGSSYLLRGEYRHSAQHGWAVCLSPGQRADEYDEPAVSSLWACVPHDVVLTAAADHCLGAAYRAACPGVDPDTLMRWRAMARAEFQRRDVDDILRDVEATTAALRTAPRLDIGGMTVADMRREPPYPELPEAAARAGLPYMSGPLASPDGRRKYTCAGEPAQVRAWMTWAQHHGYVNIYGDPERGFAGCYGAT